MRSASACRRRALVATGRPIDRSCRHRGTSQRSNRRRARDRHRGHTGHQRAGDRTQDRIQETARDQRQPLPAGCDLRDTHRTGTTAARSGLAHTQERTGRAPGHTHPITGFGWGPATTSGFGPTRSSPHRHTRRKIRTGPHPGADRARAWTRSPRPTRQGTTVTHSRSTTTRPATQSRSTPWWPRPSATASICRAEAPTYAAAGIAHIGRPARRSSGVAYGRKNAIAPKGTETGYTLTNASPQPQNPANTRHARLVRAMRQEATSEPDPLPRMPQNPQQQDGHHQGRPHRRRPLRLVRPTQRQRLQDVRRLPPAIQRTPPRHSLSMTKNTKKTKKPTKKT